MTLHPTNAHVHRGMYGLLRQNRSSEKEIVIIEIITYDPSIYKMDHSAVIACSFLV